MALSAAATAAGADADALECLPAAAGDRLPCGIGSEKALPEPLRLRGFYLWVLIGISAIVMAVGLFGGVSGLL